MEDLQPFLDRQEPTAVAKEHQQQDIWRIIKIAFAAVSAGVRPFADAPDALGRMDAEQIAAALWSLPEEYRVVATMYFIDDLSYQDMADVLEIPVGTVRSRLHRGRKLLQARLWTLAVDAGIVTAVTPSSSASPLATRRVALAHSAG